MQFDELTLHDPEGDLHVRFHPSLTMLCGLGTAERLALSESILSSAGAGRERTQLHMTDGQGRHLTVQAADGRLNARYADGSPAPDPLGSLSADPVAVRSLIVLSSEDLGARTRAMRANEPPELREARVALEELTAELDAALAEEHAVHALQVALEQLERDLRAAHDGVARREYALVLAQLERVRAEVAAIDAGTASIDSDRNLLASADAARALVQAWSDALDAVAALVTDLDGRARLAPPECERLAAIPGEAPTDLDELIGALRQAVSAHASLDHRLQSLSVSKLPAPSDPIVAELGLHEQAPLWCAADRAADATRALRQLQVSLGGVEVDEMGPAPQLIEAIEVAHAELEAAERAAAAVRLPGISGAVLGAALTVVGALSLLPIIPVGVIIAGVATISGIVRPKRRLRSASRAELAALELADATTYLGFHIRRVEASVDPELRSLVVTTMAEHRSAIASWHELVGAAELDRAMALRTEIDAYSTALRDLGDTAEEIELLRDELHGEAEPAVAAARQAVLDAIAPFELGDDHLNELGAVPEAVARQCELGAVARAQTRLAAAEADVEEIAARLDGLLLELGFDAGALDARAGALDWAIARAAEREAAREAARPRAELDAELQELQQSAAELRRPEWASVTAAEAKTPDIPELEIRRKDLLEQLACARRGGDAARLADRHAALERRVAALELSQTGHDGSSDPAVIAEIRQQLLAHLETASSAGPTGDPVPVVLDEVLARVPADRTWDLLDVVLEAAEHHQLVYLSDDAFVAAWARQRAMDGLVTLLELTPEPAAV
ncbi:MAG: hypothetical protein ACT452_01320 [Microthrixaceae bacterium]